MHEAPVAIFAKFTQPLEGRVLWPYQDILGLVTVGYGCLIEPVGLALNVQWQGDPSPETVRAEWAKANALPKALHFKMYERESSLRLTDDGCEALLEHRMLDNEVVLRKYFPGWDDFPADAQLGIMAMAWACGAGFPRTFTNFTGFANKRDWSNAAKCAKINATGNAGIIPRNAQVALCLANAAEIDDGNYGTPALYWPNPVTDATMPSTDPRDLPVSFLAARAAAAAMAKFDIAEHGCAGRADAFMAA